MKALIGAYAQTVVARIVVTPPLLIGGAAVVRSSVLGVNVKEHGAAGRGEAEGDAFQAVVLAG